MTCFSSLGFLNCGLCHGLGEYVSVPVVQLWAKFSDNKSGEHLMAGNIIFVTTCVVSRLVIREVEELLCFDAHST